MRRISLFFLSLLVVAAGCNQKSSVKDDDLEESTEVEFDSIGYVSPDGMVNIAIDIPSEDRTPITDSIFAYIADHYRGLTTFIAEGNDLQKALTGIGDSIHKSYLESIEELKGEMGDDADENSFMFNWEDANALQIHYQNDRVLTMVCEGYEYMGGAHGLNWYVGTTFDKETGKRIDNTILKDPKGEKFQKLFREKLAEYFKVSADEVYTELFLDEDANGIIPIKEPYFEKDKIIFMYQPYEISYYAAGMPTVELTYDEIKPHLTKYGKSLLVENEDEDEEEDEDNEED